MQVLQAQTNDLCLRRRFLFVFEIAFVYTCAIWIAWSTDPIMRKGLKWLALVFIAYFTFQQFDDLEFRFFKPKNGDLNPYFAYVWLVASFAVAVLAILISNALGNFHFNPHRLLGYLKGVTYQELLVYWFFYNRLERLLKSKAIFFTILAGMFALIHLPNPILTPLCFLGSYFLSFAYDRMKNIPLLVAAHWMVGSAIAFSAEPLVRHMRVGIGFYLPL